MLARKWVAQLPLAVVCLGLGLLLVIQLRTRSDVRQEEVQNDWVYLVAELVDNNARLRQEGESLQAELDRLRDTEGGGLILESLVEEVNDLRIANGLVRVSGPGIEVEIAGPITVLDLQDLINEVRNAGTEAMALNGQRIVAWSALGTDGTHVTVDGRPVQAPYHLDAIGHSQTLDTALTRPGGLISLLRRAHAGIFISVQPRDKVTLPVYDLPLQFVYAQPAE
jgi:uncharacterized protein YlxW (UPF0749 family)